MGKKGICILSAAKKKPFLADPKFLKYKDFTICDEADNGIQLWYLPFSLDAAKPEFKECAKHPHIEQEGYVLYYTDQCPFASQYALKFAEWMNSWGQACVVHHITTREAAQSCPGPVSGYALFYGNTYLTNEIQSEKKAEKLWKTYGKQDCAGWMISSMVGCETKLGTSLSRNAGISMAFWKRFNEQLKMYHVKQGKQFVKYALTRRGSQGSDLCMRCSQCTAVSGSLSDLPYSQRGVSVRGASW